MFYNLENRIEDSNCMKQALSVTEKEKKFMADQRIIFVDAVSISPGLKYMVQSLFWGPSA
jgi:hypothetical protein